MPPPRLEVVWDEDWRFWMDTDFGFRLWREFGENPNWEELSLRQQVLWTRWSHFNRMGLGFNPNDVGCTFGNNLCYSGRPGGVCFFTDADETVRVIPVHFGPLPTREIVGEGDADHDPFVISRRRQFDWIVEQINAGRQGAHDQFRLDEEARIRSWTRGRAWNRRGPIEPGDSARWRARRYRIRYHSVARFGRNHVRPAARALIYLVIMGYAEDFVEQGVAYAVDEWGWDWLDCGGPVTVPMTDEQVDNFYDLVHEETSGSNYECRSATPLRLDRNYNDTLFAYHPGPIARGEVSPERLRYTTAWYRFTPDPAVFGDWPWTFCLSVQSPNNDTAPATWYPNIKVYSGNCEPNNLLLNFRDVGRPPGELATPLPDLDELHDNGTPGQYEITMTRPRSLFVVVTSLVATPPPADFARYAFRLTAGACSVYVPGVDCAHALPLIPTNVVVGPFTLASGDHWFTATAVDAGEVHVNLSGVSLDGGAGITIYDGADCESLSSIFAGTFGAGNSCAAATSDGGNVWVKVSISTGTFVTYMLQFATGACP